MAATAMNDEELRALMSEVQAELDTALKSEKERLAKAHPGEEDSSEVPPDESATASGSDGPPEASASSPPAEGSAPPDASASPPPGPDGASPDGGGDPMADAGVADPESIKAELASMPMEHVKALYIAAKEVLFAQMGAADPAAASPPPAAPMLDASAPPTAASPSAPPAFKAEMAASSPGNGGQVKTVSKSEKDTEIEELKKKVAEFEGITSGLLSVVEKAIVVPSRKAVTSVAELNKSGSKPAGQLSKSEVKERLDRAARTRLSKSDRDLINQYTVGAINVEKVQHLLDVK
jgi:hypothetical protein